MQAARRHKDMGSYLGPTCGNVGGRMLIAMDAVPQLYFHSHAPERSFEFDAAHCRSALSNQPSLGKRSLVAPAEVDSLQTSGRLTLS